MCDTVCGWQVLVVRGKDGVLRGFHNHCRHRGARLLEAGSGSCRVIKCPYHGWGYDTSGALIATPGFSEEAGIDRATLGLQPLHVTEWRSMIFICVDSDPQPFSDWVGSLDAMLDDLPGIDVMEFHGRFDVHGDANWKTYCDNTVEGYHLPAVHPRLATAVRGATVDISNHDEGRLVVFDVDYGGEGAGLRGDKGLWAYRYPGFQIAISNNAFKIERVEATGVGTTRSLNWGWYRNLDEDAIADSFAWSETVVREDLGICETVQQSMAAGVYRDGPLCPQQEGHVIALQANVRKDLGISQD